MYNKQRSNLSRGITLIDILVSTGLLVVVFIGIIGIFRLSVDLVSNNKARAGAIALANERMEYVHSLTYDALGTVSGIPSGTIPQSESVSLNNIPYTRRVVVEYADDPKDGSGLADANGVIEDYKVAKVDVAWSSKSGTRHVTLVGRISPTNGMESAVPGGTLAISVVDALGTAVSSAQVHIVNASASPAVDVTTFTNVSGAVNIIGAPAASGYQITVSKTGYSTAKTYSSTGSNPNPTPANLTVSNNQTTSSTFAIDLLGSKTINTYSQVLTNTWTDALNDSSKIATSTNVDISGGAARLVNAPGPYPTYGEFQSIPVSTSTLSRWKTFTWSGTLTGSTNLLTRFLNGSGTLIPDSALPGNAAGFATTSVDISSISTTTYPSLIADVTLSSTDSAETPTINSYSISYDYGPVAIPNVGIDVQGVKRIGDGPPAVYKYDTATSTNSSGTITLTNMEWDTYATTLTGNTYDIASSCSPQPEGLSPGQSATTRLYLAAHTTNSLLVDVRGNAGAILPNAQVRVYRITSPLYDTTTTTDSCGQSFFGSLSAATYSVSVSAGGYATYTNNAVDVSGSDRLSVTLN